MNAPAPQLSRSDVIHLMSEGMDTCDIARLCGVHESAVWNLLPADTRRPARKPIGARPRRTLTPEVVATIRALDREGLPLSQIAALIPTQPATARRALRMGA